MAEDEGGGYVDGSVSSALASPWLPLLASATAVESWRGSQPLPLESTLSSLLWKPLRSLVLGAAQAQCVASLTCGHDAMPPQCRPNSNTKADVIRLRWQRVSVIVMHRIGLIKELIRLGFMTARASHLPTGHPGHNFDKYKELGVGYTQGTFVKGKRERTIVGDEKNDSIEYDPGRSPGDLMLHDAELTRISTSIKALLMVTGFYSATLSGQSFPIVVTLKRAAQASPGTYIPQCQLCAETEHKHTGACDCVWRDASGDPVVRSDVRTMSWALCEKACPNMALELLHCGLTRGGRVGKVLSVSSLGRVPFGSPSWHVGWNETSAGVAEEFEEMAWPALQAVLCDSYEPSWDPAGAVEALRFAATLRRSIPPQWFVEAPQAEMRMDGRDKIFCTVVGYTESGGTTNPSYRTMRVACWDQCYDEISVLNPIVTIVDGGPGRINTRTNIDDAARGSHSASTAPNCSGSDQIHDHSALFGAGKVAQNQRIADIVSLPNSSRWAFLGGRAPRSGRHRGRKAAPGRRHGPGAPPGTPTDRWERRRGAAAAGSGVGARPARRCSPPDI